MVRLALSAAVLVLLAASPAQGAQRVRLPDGNIPTISADGNLVAFQSTRDLDPADEDGEPCCDEGYGYFFTALGSGRYTRIATPVGDEPPYTLVSGGYAELSGDGRFVALPAGGGFDGREGSPEGIYLRHLASGAAVRLGPSPTNVPHIAISRDGSTVAWESYEGSVYTLYVWRGGAVRAVGTNEFRPSLSGDGRLIAFTRQEGESKFGAFVRNLATGKVRRVSVDGRGRPEPGWAASISANGRFVTFRSDAQLISGVGSWDHIYRRDLDKKRTRLVTTNEKGRVPAVGDIATSPFGTDGSNTQVSATGRRVAFQSAARLVKGDRDSRDDLYVKDMESQKLVRVELGDQSLTELDFRLSADGGTLIYSLAPQLFALRLNAQNPICERPDVPAPHDLRGLMDHVVDLELAPTEAELDRARAALNADSEAHPENKAVNDRRLAEMKALVKRLEPRGGAAADDEVSKLVDDARCALLEDAKSHLSDYLKDKGHGDKLELLDNLSTLRDIFKGEVEERDKEKLLETNVEELLTRLGGEDAKKKHGGAILRAYRLLKEDLKGNLKDEVRKQLRDDLIKEVKTVSKKLFGRDAPEVVDKLLVLRDVISGDLSDAKRQAVLQDSLGALAQKLLGKGILNSPQVRAAMFGFQLGRAFGERIAADLELITTKNLASDCAVALGKHQSTPGTVDYSKPDTAFVPSGLWHEGWQCTILGDGFVPGVAGGMVRATRPSNASRKNKLLWRITTAGEEVVYDPAYSR